MHNAGLIILKGITFTALLKVNLIEITRTAEERIARMPSEVG